jgi:hypothetical protein
MGGDSRTARLILCRECLAEFREIIDRADDGDSEARKTLDRELAKLWESLGVDGSE